MSYAGRGAALVATVSFAIACGSVAQDPHACGVQGVDCLGGTCNNGTCGPVTLAAGIKFGRALTLDDARVYWADQAGKVSTVLKVGGASMVLADLAAAQAVSIATDEKFVYVATFTDGDAGGVHRAPKDGSSATLLAARGMTTSVRVDTAGCVVWASLGGTNSTRGIERLCPSAASPEAVVGGQPSSLAVDGSALYWADGVPLTFTGFVQPCGEEPASLKVLSSGSSPVTIARGFPSMGNSALGTDADSLYWRDRCTGVVHRLPHGGSAPIALAAVPSKPYDPWTGHYHYDGLVAVDAFGAYVNSDQGVVRVPKDGSAIRVILAGQRAEDIATDATRVYVLTNHELFAVAKPPAP